MADYNESDRIAAHLRALSATFPFFSLPPLKNWPAINPVMDDVSRRLGALTSGLNAAFAPMQATLRFLEEQSKLIGLLEQAGWLPHASAPLHLINVDMTPQQVDGIMADYLTSHWTVVADSLVAGVDAYILDQEAKDAFREALHAHGFGLYRVAPRLLFPEIERVSRLELHGGAYSGIASQHVLRKAAGSLGLSELPTTGMAGMRLYEKLVDHLYVRVETEAARDLAAADSVPNRHASLHGVISYVTLKSSANMIFMCDFIFGSISALNQMSSTVA